jgi:hypothetical protein
LVAGWGSLRGLSVAAVTVGVCLVTVLPARRGCCVLELNRWRRIRQDAPLAGYQELCRELAAAGPGTFGELDTTGARSVLRIFTCMDCGYTGHRDLVAAANIAARAGGGTIPTTPVAGGSRTAARNTQAHRHTPANQRAGALV